MRVFQINTVYNSGSTGRIVADLKHMLEENGHECFVAYGRGNSAEPNTECVSNKLDLYHHALMTRLTDKTGFYSKGATRKLIKRIEEFQPDIVHLHNIHGYYLNIEMLFRYLKKINKPIVWTLHDCWPFTGHCAYFDMVGCNKWMKECTNCPALKEYPKSVSDNSKENYKRKKELFTGMKELTIVTPSKWLATIVEDSFLGKYTTKVINNGIDIETFKPTYGEIREKYCLENKKVILGVASVWDKRKGLDDFIKLADCIDDETVIVLVGLTSKQIESLPGNVVGIARTESKKELAELYTLANVLFNPTYEDNYPTVNLEALACGTPVITYASGGSCESAFLDENDAVKKGDYRSAFEKIQSGTIKNQLVHRGSISLESMKEQYLKLYAKIIRG